MKISHIKYSDLENYVFTDVHAKFKDNGFLSAFDFFCIVIWKANRAKSKVAKRLLKHNKNLEEGVKELTNEIFTAENPKRKFEILFTEYGFRLPMASAILTALYPDTFTIYDFRVCETLSDFDKLGDIGNFEKIWEGYKQYIERVTTSEPSSISLREKDKLFWGTSFFNQLTKDINEQFSKT